MTNTDPRPHTFWERLAKVAVVVGVLLVFGALIAAGRFAFGYTGFLARMLLQVGPAVGLLLLMAILFSLYMEIIRRQYIAGLPWTFLQVLVPEDNERTPRAMEEVFNLLHGVFRPPDLYDLYLDGYVQAWLSVEIRGHPGSVSFVFRVPAGLRQLFEAAVYAQYPNADIHEVEDYAATYHLEDLGKTIDLWGTEFMLLKPDAYPVRSYVDFENELSEAEGERMVDPMATIAEAVSSIDQGEETWIQILFRPEIPGMSTRNWQREGEEIALKLAGRELLKKPSRFQRLLGAVGTVVTALLPGPKIEPKRESKLDLGVLRLTPGETDVVRAIQRNVSKAGFSVLIRAISLGPHGVYQRRKRISMVFGIFRQFSAQNLNSIIPDGKFTTSRPIYGLSPLRQAYRKRRLLRRYQARFFRERGFIFNSEELATIFHFPLVYTKTPTVEHARARKGEPPPNVPLMPAGELMGG